MRTRCPAFFLLALSIWPMEGIVGQVGSQPETGDRVRVAVRQGQAYSHSLLGSQAGTGSKFLIRGTFSSVDDGRLVVAGSRGNGVWKIPLTSLQSVEVFGGREPFGIRAVWYGMLVGGTVGALSLPVVTAHDSDTCGFLGCNSDGGGRLVFAGLGALAGGMVGGLIGTLVKRDRWDLVGPDAFRLAVLGSHGSALTLGIVGELRVFAPPPGPS